MRGVRSARAGDHVPSARMNAPNLAGATSHAVRPSPQTCFSESRPGPARWTTKTVGAGATVRRDDDARSKVAAGEGMGRAGVEGRARGAVQRADSLY